MNTSPSEARTIEPTTVEERVVKLREGGMSIANIMEQTGISERRVKQLIVNITKPKKRERTTSNSLTPFSKAVERVFILATRKVGIRDYELRDILHEEYGSTWDTSVGSYQSSYDSDKIKRVKAKVRARANKVGRTAIFAMDWIDETAPQASSQFLVAAAGDLVNRISDYVTEYMATHSTQRMNTGPEGELARRKQRYAAWRHLLKLAIPGFAPEPLEKLMERTAALVGELEGCPDLPIREIVYQAKYLTAEAKKSDFYPEPSRTDSFLDFVEAQGWLNASKLKA